jgi:hypothetical protein
MRKNYDFSKAVQNPYANRLKRHLTIRLDVRSRESVHTGQRRRVRRGQTRR